jgi:hypothetical protein
VAFVQPGFKPGAVTGQRSGHPTRTGSYDGNATPNARVQ